MSGNRQIGKNTAGKIRNAAFQIQAVFPAMLVLGVFSGLIFAAGGAGNPVRAANEPKAEGKVAVVGETLRWAAEADPHSMDPYTLNETFTLGFLGNIYEGLIRRNEKLEIEPALAESWELMSPTRWRFHLRRGVRFHNGNVFNADDVLFSVERVRAEGSDLKSRLPEGLKVEKLDDYTVEFITPTPNPVLFNEWDNWHIMDREWSEEHQAQKPSTIGGQQVGYATLHANGTGPFRLLSWQRDVKAELEANPDWWDKPRHNLARIVFTPIESDPTRVAALLSGQVDLVTPVPVQDMARLEASPDIALLKGNEVRTIFLGFDHKAEQLKGSSVEGRNPFRDVRVRQAVMQAIDIEAIRSRVMRSMARPSALMVAPELFALSDRFARLPFDPDASRRLLIEAGYPEGFSVPMDCPTNRYVNDVQICQAVVSMLARVGIQVDLQARPKAAFYAKVLGPKYDTAFFLIGWTPISYDAWNVLNHLHKCRDPETDTAMFNLGGYCSEQVDALTDQIMVEQDVAKRNGLIEQAFRITTEDIAYIPLHQQGIAWGARQDVHLPVRADNRVVLRLVRVGEPVADPTPEEKTPEGAAGTAAPEQQTESGKVN